ncbi:MAG: glycosyltransferase family 2 protein [Candidatus Freyarchaeota archaeon]
MEKGLNVENEEENIGVNAHKGEFHNILNPRISIVIPCFNEEKGLKYILPDIHNVMKNTNFPYEIIVVDDGSKDETRKIAQRYSATVLINSKNIGKGASLIKGFNCAKGDIIITMDGDGSHRASDIPRLIEPLLNDHYEVVIGSRFLNTSELVTSISHTIGNKIFNALIWIVTGKYFTDSQSGFRAFKKKVINSIKNELKSREFEIESEILIKLLKKRKKNKILELPINVQNRIDGNSKISLIKDGFKILKTIIRSFFEKEYIYHRLRK